MQIAQPCLAFSIGFMLLPKCILNQLSFLVPLNLGKMEVNNMNPIKNILIGLAYLTVIFSLVGAVIFN